MKQTIDKGSWVQIYCVVLPAGERAPQVPDDTRQIPLEMRVKGRLVASAHLGDEAEIVTAVGRRLRGVVEVINPAYTHGFGAPIAELSAIGREVRALLHGGRGGL
jgi:hypothetical protein